MPYETVKVKLTAKQRSNLAKGAANGVAVGLVLGDKGEDGQLMLTGKQFADYSAGKRRFRITPTAIKKMKGGGFFSNLGESVGKAVQNVGDELEGEESKTANDLANFAMDIGDTLDSVFTGKRMDFKQAAKNANISAASARKFLAKSKAEQEKEFRLKARVLKQFGGISSLAEYIAMNEKLAGMPQQTEKSVKAARRARRRGDVAGSGTPAGKITGRPMRPKMKGGATLGEMAAEFIRAELAKN